jgi:hypothetical protein
MTERLMTEVEEDFLREWFIDDGRPSFPHPLGNAFPFVVEIEDVYSAQSYCFKMFGKRFFNFGNKRVEFNHSARWDMYIFPRFRTEEDAVMFKLGYPGK